MTETYYCDCECVGCSDHSLESEIVQTETIDLDKTITVRELIQLCRAYDENDMDECDALWVLRAFLMKLYGQEELLGPHQGKSPEEIDSCVLNPVEVLLDQFYGGLLQSQLDYSKEANKKALKFRRGITTQPCTCTDENNPMHEPDCPWLLEITRIRPNAK